jgi:hypothetical protein
MGGRTVQTGTPSAMKPGGYMEGFERTMNDAIGSGDVAQLDALGQVQVSAPSVNPVPDVYSPSDVRISKRDKDQTSNTSTTPNNYQDAGVMPNSEINGYQLADNSKGSTVTEEDNTAAARYDRRTIIQASASSILARVATTPLPRRRIRKRPAGRTCATGYNASSGRGEQCAPPKCPAVSMPVRIMGE